MFAGEEVSAVDVTAVKENGVAAGLIDEGSVPFGLRPPRAARGGELHVDKLLITGGNANRRNVGRRGRIALIQQRIVGLLVNYDETIFRDAFGKREAEMHEAF